MSKETKAKAIKKVGSRVEKLSDKVTKLERQVEENKEEIEILKRNEAIRLLKEKNDLNESKPKYTYDDIANHLKVSKTKVAEIAKDNNLSRRNMN